MDFPSTAGATEADYRASAAGEDVRQLRDTIARDIRTTLLRTQSNFQRIAATPQLLDQANSAFDLAQARYKFVEVSQAQLAQTEAQIDFRYRQVFLPRLPLDPPASERFFSISNSAVTDALRVMAPTLFASRWRALLTHKERWTSLRLRHSWGRSTAAAKM